MLKESAVAPGTLALLKRLMRDEVLKDFVLVGGTSLALQVGHRKSIDLDLFTKLEFDSDKMRIYLEEKYSFIARTQFKNTLMGFMDGVKVDLLTHAYPDVVKPIETEGVRLATLTDIAAMKLNAIVGSGERLKDFVDIADLSAEMPLKTMLDAYEIKYHNNKAIAIRALTYHDQIVFDEPIELIDGMFDWKKVEKRIANVIKEPLKTFPQMIQGHSATKDTASLDTNYQEEGEPKKQAKKGRKI